MLDHVLLMLFTHGNLIDSLLSLLLCFTLRSGVLMQFYFQEVSSGIQDPSLTLSSHRKCQPSYSHQTPISLGAASVIQLSMDFCNICNLSRIRLLTISFYEGHHTFATSSPCVRSQNKYIAI